MSFRHHTLDEDMELGMHILKILLRREPTEKEKYALRDELIEEGEYRFYEEVWQSSKRAI